MKRQLQIENKRFREILRFRDPMISRTYDPRRETVVSFGERLLSLFFRLVVAQNAMAAKSRLSRRAACGAAP
jgi:hypothetical protein